MTVNIYDFTAEEFEKYQKIKEKIFLLFFSSSFFFEKLSIINM